VSERSKAATFLVVLAITGALLLVAGKTDHTRPQPPACKVCHCGKVSCHRACSEESMCVMQCERLCKH